MNITNVLVVDDDVAICRIVRRMLSNERCDVQMSQPVAGAHEAIEQKPFDVYVLDYKLPDGSGLDVAEWSGRNGMRLPSFLCQVMTHMTSR